LTTTDYRNAYLIIVGFFIVSEFAYLPFAGTYQVYIADYICRITFLGICFYWPISRSILTKRSQHTLGLLRGCIWAIGLFIVGYIIAVAASILYAIFLPVSPFYKYPSIDDPYLYFFDLTFGLVLVVLSEELICRKLAWQWLSRTGKSAMYVCLVSAAFFSATHWGRGFDVVFITFFIGVLYMAAYIKLGKLWPIMCAHFLNNFYVLGPFHN